MNVRVKLVGFPDLEKRLGGKEVPVDLDGSTFGDLLQWLQRTHGDPAQTRLVDRSGCVDPDVLVLRNGRERIAGDDLGCELCEGDQLTFLVVVAGG